MELAVDWAFAPLPWQLSAWARIGSIIEAGRLPHALMVTGAVGTGKARFLQALTARLLCHRPSEATACGSCRSCALLAAGSHADWLQVGVEEGSRVIKVDQVRDLVEFAAMTPALGERKIILLGPAEAMNLNAANALLKSLEEPGRSTCFLLFSHQPSAVPATVRSRCQRIDLTSPTSEQALAWLARMTGSESLARELLEACGRRPLEALDLHAADGLRARQAVSEALVALQAGRLSPLDFPGLVAELDLDTVFALLQSRVEDVIRSGSEARGSDLRPLFQLYDEITRQRRAVRRGANPNRQLLIEDCATRFHSALGENSS